MSDRETDEVDRESPSLDGFDLSNVPEPEDGVLWLYRSFVDGFWRIDNRPDMALQEATGYPVGELVEYEEMGDWEDGEKGELRALYVGDGLEADVEKDEETEWFIHRFRCPDCDQITRADRMVPCFRCGAEMEHEDRIGEVHDAE